MRVRFAAGSAGPMNLLGIRWIDRFARWKRFQPVLQIPVLALTTAIVLLGFFDVQDSVKNLATKLTWSVWWPGIVLTFILLGRVWCVVCPFGALNEAAARCSGTHRLFPRALRGLWMATFIFVVLTWADEQFGIIRSPRLTAELIVFLASVALATGIFYQRRSFCRYLCPITGLQALYAMASPVELRVRDRALCSSDCRQSCYRGTASSPGCPMFEFPMSMERNTHCSFCLGCVRTCPKNNIVLRLRSFGADLWLSTRRSLDESYLALALVGLTTVVTAQMLGDWGKWISVLSRLLRGEIGAGLKPVTYFTLTETTLFLVVALGLAPMLGYAAAWAAFRITGAEGLGARKLFVGLGYMFAPVGLAMHLAHNLASLLLEGPGIVPALRRLFSLHGSSAVAELDWVVTPMIDPTIVHALQMALILIGLAFSIVVGARSASKFLSRETAAKALVPFIALSLAFSLINLYMLNQPMGMRRGM